MKQFAILKLLIQGQMNRKFNILQAIKLGIASHDTISNIIKYEHINNDEVTSEVIINDSEDPELILNKLSKIKNLRNLKSVKKKGNDKIIIKHINNESALENLNIIQKEFTNQIDVFSHNNFQIKMINVKPEEESFEEIKEQIV